VLISILLNSLAHTSSSVVSGGITFEDRNQSDTKHERCEALLSRPLCSERKLQQFDTRLRALLPDDAQGRFVRRTLLNLLRTHIPERPLVLHIVGPLSLQPLIYTVIQHLIHTLHFAIPSLISLKGTDDFITLQRAFHSLVVLSLSLSLSLAKRFCLISHPNIDSI
jgi:hypothetical protein